MKECMKEENTPSDTIEYKRVNILNCEEDVNIDVINEKCPKYDNGTN